MKYPAKQYKSLRELEIAFPVRYYSIVLHVQQEYTNLFRVYDSMGVLVHQATVPNGKFNPTVEE
jgi:hypothetical protein